MWRKPHPVENIALQIDTRSNFNQAYPLSGEFKNGALGHIDYPLTPGTCLDTGEGNLIDLPLTSLAIRPCVTISRRP